MLISYLNLMTFNIFKSPELFLAALLQIFTASSFRCLNAVLLRKVGKGGLATKNNEVI